MKTICHLACYCLLPKALLGWRDLFYMLFVTKLYRYLFFVRQRFAEIVRFSVTKCGHRTSERFLSGWQLFLSHRALRSSFVLATILSFDQV